MLDACQPLQHPLPALWRHFPAISDQPIESHYDQNSDPRRVRIVLPDSQPDENGSDIDDDIFLHNRNPASSSSPTSSSSYSTSLSSLASALRIWQPFARWFGMRHQLQHQLDQARHQLAQAQAEAEMVKKEAETTITQALLRVHEAECTQADAQQRIEEMKVDLDRLRQDNDTLTQVQHESELSGERMRHEIETLRLQCVIVLLFIFEIFHDISKWFCVLLLKQTL